MHYTWHPAYREAILETDQPKMRARLLLAENKIVDRLRVLSQDHGGTAEERQAIVDALNGIKNLRSKYGLRLQPNHAKALVCVLGVLLFVLDLATPADVDISIFYSFIIVLCAWTRSLAFLCGTTIIFAAAVLPPLLLAPQPLSWILLENRLFAMAALALVAGLVHFRIRDFRLLENMNQELHTALDEVETLRGILLICSYCKKIEANPETWVDLENYVRRHSEAEFNHGVCPDCLRKVTQEMSQG